MAGGSRDGAPELVGAVHVVDRSEPVRRGLAKVDPLIFGTAVASGKGNLRTGDQPDYHQRGNRGALDQSLIEDPHDEREGGIRRRAEELV